MWPLHHISHVFFRIGNHQPRLFCKMALTSGFWQTSLDEASRKFTAFITFMGIFEWNRVAMGLKGAPSYFQQSMASEVLADILYIFVELYLDDLLLWAGDEDELVSRLREVFIRLRRHKITLNPKKCAFALTDISFLGRELNSLGVAVPNEKIEKLMREAKPRTIKGLRRFLGMVNHFREHIIHYVTVSEPLNAMLRGVGKTRQQSSNIQLQWSDEASKAYEDLLMIVAHLPRLYFVNPDFLNNPLILETDASDYGVGLYLSQEIDGIRYPIRLASRSFTSTERRWPANEKEAYGVIWAVKLLEYLLRDVRFKLRTDHRNLTFINNSGSPKVLRWKLEIQAFDFVLQYIEGPDNVISDYLSRAEPEHIDEEEVAIGFKRNRDGNEDALSNKRYASINLINANIICLECTDSAKETCACAVHNPLNTVHVFEENDKLLRLAHETSAEEDATDRNYQHDLAHEILKREKLQTLKLVHGSLPGHHGFERTMLKLLKLLQALKKPPWKGIRKDVKNYLSSCPYCQKISRVKPVINSIRFTTNTYLPWECINIDTIGPLPMSKRGTDHLLVVIDCFTRFAEIMPFCSTKAEETKVKLLEIFGRYGPPQAIRSDGGSEFDNKLIESLLEAVNTVHMLTLAYSKEENSMVERLNKETMRHINALVFECKDEGNIEEYAPLCMRIINNTFHESIGCTPAQLLFGDAFDTDRGIIIPFMNHDDPNRPKSVQSWLDRMLTKQSKLIKYAQDMQLKKATEHTKDNDSDDITQFKIGDYVLNKYPKTRMGELPPTKMHTFWQGPKEVVEQESKSVYILRDLVTSECKPYHIKRLKLYIVDPESHQKPEEVAMADNREFLVEEILDHRGDTKHVRTLEFLVKWLGYDNRWNEWRPWSDDDGHDSGIRNNAKLHEYLRRKNLKSLLKRLKLPE